MEENSKKNDVAYHNDRKILFSKAVKAGKRIYYIDVKQNKKDELFLAITESKKVVNSEGDNLKVVFEKHKIFLYQEDFEKFANGLSEAVKYITENQTTANDKENEVLEEEITQPTEELLVEEELNDGDIKIDIEF